MIRGFYTLGSGMLTRSRVLTGISNNLANVETPGYKKELVTTTTFGTMMMNRVDSGNKMQLSDVTLMNIADKTNVIHSQGSLKSTGRSLDFAIQGQGFFAVQGNNGIVYTRNGSFNVDAEGYLTLDGVGRVMGENGPIQVGTDSFSADSEGNLTVNGQAAGKVAVYDFNDYNALQISGAGMFTSTGGQPALVQTPKILWKTVEGSNVDAAQEMTNALSTQRGLQNCSQAIKMYDATLEKAVTDIAKV